MEELDFESWIRARQKEVAGKINQAVTQVEFVEGQLAALRVQTTTLRGALVGLKEAEARFIAEMTDKSPNDETIQTNSDG